MSNLALVNENKSLTTLVSEVAAIEEALIESGGEITPEIELMLATKEVNLPAKVDGYASVIERFEMIEEFYKNKADQILKIAKAAGAVSARCKENLKFAMKELNTTELVGHDIKFKLSPSQPSVVVDDESKIDPVYKVTKTTITVDKKAIAEDLKNGLPVVGAHLEQGFSLRKSINRSSK